MKPNQTEEPFKTNSEESEFLKQFTMKPQTEGSTGVEKVDGIDFPSDIYAKQWKEQYLPAKAGFEAGVRHMEAEQERSYNKGWNDAIEAIVEKLGDDLNKNEHVERYWPTLKPELENLKIANLETNKL